MTYKRESETVEKYLIEQWKKRMGPGARCDKTIVAARRGYPDRQCLAGRGVFVLAECKTIGGKLEPHQKREHNRLRKLGFKVYVPWTREQVDEMIDEVIDEAVTRRA